MSYDKPGVKTTRENLPANRSNVGAFVNVGMIGVGDGGLSVVEKTVIRDASSLDDFVDTDMQAGACKYRGISYVANIDYSVIAGGSIRWGTTKLTSPYLKSAQAVSLAGTLAIGTYFYAVAAIKKITANSYGETLVSNVVSVVLAVAGKAVISWGQVELAEGYRIYRGTSASALYLIRELDGSTSNIWEDTGVYTPSGTAAPSVNTALRRPPSSIADTNGYWTGGDASGNVAALKAISAGSISLNMDGRGAVIVTGIDFTPVGVTTLAHCATTIETACKQQLGDRGYFISADASLNLANLQSVTAGAFKISINGATAVAVSAIDLHTAGTFDDVAALLQVAIRAADVSLEAVVVTYDATLGMFSVFSDLRGSTSAVAITAPVSGTDLRASTYLNFVNGAAVVGAIYNLTVAYNAVAKTFIITSATAGDSSSVVVAAGSAVDITTAGTTATIAAAGGVATAGVTGERISYTVDASVLGRNFFLPETYFDLSSIGTAHGVTSALYAMAKQMMATPPSGFGAQQLTLVGVPSLTRSSVGAALEELFKVDVDIVCAITNDIDIARDVVAHAVYCSRDDIKKERVAVVSLDASRVSYSAYIALAAEFASYGDRAVLVYDSFTTETYIAPLISAMQAALLDRATSMLTSSFQTLLPLLRSGRVDGNAETFMLSNGVMVLSKNDSGVLTVIDDVTCAGPTFDLPGRLVEDYIRKSIRSTVTSLKGRKLLTALYEAIQEAAGDVLDGAVYDELIAGWDKASCVATVHPTNPEGVVLRFRYQRGRTFKWCDVYYSVYEASATTV